MAQGRFTKIISMIKWIRPSRLSIKNSRSTGVPRWRGGCHRRPPRPTRPPPRCLSARSRLTGGASSSRLTGSASSARCRHPRLPPRRLPTLKTRRSLEPLTILESLTWHWSHWPGRPTRCRPPRRPSNLGGLGGGRRPASTCSDVVMVYRGSSLTRNNPSLGLYSRLMPRALWWSLGGGLSRMSGILL